MAPDRAATARLTADELKAFGERLRAARRDANKTLVQVAAAAGLTHSAVAQIEQGGNCPRLDTLVFICRAIGRDVSDILGQLDKARLNESQLSTADSSNAQQQQSTASVNNLTPSDTSATEVKEPRAAPAARGQLSTADSSTGGEMEDRPAPAKRGRGRPKKQP